MKKPEPINEPCPISPVYVDGLSSIDTVGPVTHLVFTRRHKSVWGGSRERVVEARLIVPNEQREAIARLLLGGDDAHDTHEGEQAPLH